MNFISNFLKKRESVFSKNTILKFSLFSFIFVSLLALSGLFSSVISAENEELTGYAWSPNIGWIEMSGVFLDSDTGAFSGYAWSPNIGWVSFNGGSDISGCVGAVNPYVSNGQAFGTARAINGTIGGYYDGCIDLSGVSLTQTGQGIQGAFSGYGWGGGVIGWVEFSGSYVNIAPEDAPPTAYLFVSEGDNPIPASGSYNLTLGWSSINAESCDASDFGGSSSAGVSGTRQVTIPDGTDSVTFNISCVGENDLTGEDILTIWREGTTPPPEEEFDPAPIFEEF